MMFGGGGGGGFGGPGGAQASAASGLPFAGIPPELQDGVDKLLATEPEYADPDIVFSQNSSDAELKRLESHGYATSRVQSDGGPRGRRTYKITESGRDAVTKWATEAPIDPPMLKHGVLLRVWLGHLNDPDRLKEILQEHIAHVDTMRQRVAIDSQAAAGEPAWAYPRIAMQWSERYFAAERELALQLIKDIDEADAAFKEGQRNSHGAFPAPRPGHWREVEQRVQETDPDRP